MTLEIALVLSILLLAVFFLVTEWVPMEVVALLVLSSLAITGLVTYGEALAGFSNSAVITVWAVFILSGGLTRTGLANMIGLQVMRLAGGHEFKLIVVIMVSAGCMSAFMNNVAVAALLLPVIMDIARQTNQAPSRLLLPLAYGSLLGGLTTQIGTPPNILVSEALAENGLRPFSLFDYTPTGVAIMVAGVAFVALVGRHLLPHARTMDQRVGRRTLDVKARYELGHHLLTMTIPARSVLVGKTLAETRLGSVLGIQVVGITRHRSTLLAPGATTRLQAGDILVCRGSAERTQELNAWHQLRLENVDVPPQNLWVDDLQVVEASIPRHSPFVGKSLTDIELHTRFGPTALAIRHGPIMSRADIQNKTLQAGEILLIHGRSMDLDNLAEARVMGPLQPVTLGELDRLYRLRERLLEMRVPERSLLSGKTLGALRLGDALGMRVLLIRRQGGITIIPRAETPLEPNDVLMIEGKTEDLKTLAGLEELIITAEEPAEQMSIESDAVGLTEAVLSPQTTLAGKTLRKLNFREKYGLTVLAVWREGKILEQDIRDAPLRFGDALLIHGPLDKLHLLGQEPDFLVLTKSAQEPIRREKFLTSILVMAGVLLPVILGWLPISVAAVTGAALMVLTRCLTMGEAYRFIEWKAVFLIAGMLPLGTALDQTGAARLIAEGVVGLVGPLGPTAVVLAVLVLAVLGACMIPPAAVVVLMAPIVLNTAGDLAMSPYPMMMGVAMAAASSFMTPISHPANVLVMGPGGYRFVDYIKVGLPLTLVTLLVLMLVLPLFWPF